MHDQRLERGVELNLDLRRGPEPADLIEDPHDMAMEPARGALQPGLVVDDPVVHRRTVNCDIGSFRGRYNPCGNGLYEKAEPGLGDLSGCALCAGSGLRSRMKLIGQREYGDT